VRLGLFHSNLGQPSSSWIQVAIFSAPPAANMVDILRVRKIIQRTRCGE
jgi:hypothetical protein